MPQAGPNYNLCVLKPNLVKEWHPTKNTGLKPQELTPGSGKKVWWICKNGHEWEAVIKSRSKGSGCPYCQNSKSVKDRSVAVSNSEFKIEWHPTANGNLTPAAVTMDHPGKVWWICREGHEWQASFIARIQGKDCPVCEQRRNKDIQSRSGTGISNGTAARRSYSMPDTEPFDNFFGADVRKKRRYETSARVTLEVSSSNHLFFARLKNFSQEGMCLEISTALTPGTKVNVRLDRPLLGSSQGSYDSVIKWCKGLADEQGSVYNFGVGVKFI